MPHYHLWSRTFGKLPLVEDDAPDARALGDRLLNAQHADERLVTSVRFTERDLEEAAREGVPTNELPELGHMEITGSWDSHDILHVVGEDVIAEEVDIEGEANNEEDERPDPKILAGGGKRK